MTRLHIVCEGQTEETFVRDVIIPEIGSSLSVVYSMVNTSPGHRGGALSYQRVQKHLRNTLRQSSAPFVTTLFDLYRLDDSFPGHAEAAGKPLEQRLNLLNTKWHESIIATAECRPGQFLPYIQAYEFEALLFSDVSTVVSLEPEWAKAELKLQAVRDSVETPEHINDGPTTKPAAHLERHLTQPAYRKTLHGPIAASLIGLAKIEEQCHYFSAWLASLRELGTRT